MAKPHANKEKNLNITVSDVWPQERDYFERPERFKYVRKILVPQGCVFCKAHKSQPTLSSLLLVKRKHSMVILNKYPYNCGHLLVLPTRHVGHLWDLKKTEYLELMDTLKASVEITQKVMKTKNLNLGMNHGDVAGAGIPHHLHWHIIPRWFGDTNFFPVIAETKVHAQSLGQVFKAMHPHFKKWKESLK